MKATWQLYVCQGGVENGTICWRADVWTGKVWLWRAAWEDNVLYGESSDCTTHMMPYTGQAMPDPPEPSEPLWWRALVELGKRHSHGSGLPEWEELSDMRRWEIAGEIIEALIDRKCVISWYPEKRSCDECVAVVDPSVVEHCVSVRSGDRPLAVVEVAARLVGLSDDHGTE